MLVLTRKPGEQLIIGGITVRVVDVIGKRVRLGIEAPDFVRVLRGEVPGWAGDGAGDGQPDPGLGREPGGSDATVGGSGPEAAPH